MGARSLGRTAEGREEGVPEEARRHFRCIQQVLHKCLSPSLVKQKAGWELRRRMSEKGESEGRGQRQASWWLSLSGAQPTLQLLDWDKGALSLASSAWGQGRGCCVWGVGRCLSLSHSVSLHLPTSLCASLCVSVSCHPTVPLSPLSKSVAPYFGLCSTVSGSALPICLSVSPQLLSLSFRLCFWEVGAGWTQGGQRRGVSKERRRQGSERVRTEPLY